MNPFDSIQAVVFDTVTSIMGYGAEWQPASGPLLRAKVLYKGPTEKEKLFAVEYDPNNLVMEWKIGDFPGLYEASRSNQALQEVAIEGQGVFYIKTARKKSDGRYYEASLEVKSE